MTKSTQTAGDQSTQIHTQTMIVNTGLSLAEFEHVARTQTAIMLQEYSVEAEATARLRAEHLNSEVASRLHDAGLLNAAASPSFQIALRRAQVEAAGTSDNEQIDMLASILQERAANPEKTTLKLFTNKAIECATMIEPETLKCLSFAWLVPALVLQGKTTSEAIAMVESTLPRPDEILPSNGTWVRDLEVVGAIKATMGNIFKRVKYDEQLARSSSVRISNGFVAEEQFTIRQRAVLLTGGLLDVHPFDSTRLVSTLGKEQIRVNSAAIQAITGLKVEQYIEIVGLNLPCDERKVEVLSELNANEVFRHAIEWFNDLPPFEITPVGILLVHCNLRHVRPNLQLAEYESFL